jgi:transglutaminase-like putative cysteine protease
MKFKITHESTYLFDGQIFLEPHYLRFRPRKTSFLEVLDFSIAIHASPSGHRIVVDEENNMVDFCWFEGMIDQLYIKAESVLEITPFNPFDFIIQPEHYNRLPFAYNAFQHKLLFATLDATAISQELINYGNNVLKASNYNTISYLIDLTKTIHTDFMVVYREAGDPMLPDETFKSKQGSCRDLSWMLIHLLRHNGIAARFTSGYYYFEMENPTYELHAWVDVFLPGTGWIGLDASHGILTGNTHFPVASSAHFSHTMPVSGSIRGSANSVLNTTLSIEKI